MIRIGFTGYKLIAGDCHDYWAGIPNAVREAEYCPIRLLQLITDTQQQIQSVISELSAKPGTTKALFCSPGYAALIRG